MDALRHGRAGGAGGRLLPVNGRRYASKRQGLSRSAVGTVIHGDHFARDGARWAHCGWARSTWYIGNLLGSNWPFSQHRRSAVHRQAAAGRAASPLHAGAAAGGADDDRTAIIDWWMRPRSGARCRRLGRAGTVAAGGLHALLPSGMTRPVCTETRSRACFIRYGAQGRLFGGALEQLRLQPRHAVRPAEAGSRQHAAAAMRPNTGMWSRTAWSGGIPSQARQAPVQLRPHRQPIAVGPALRTAAGRRG